MVSKAAITRLSRVAGIERINHEVYIEVENYLEIRLEEILNTIDLLVHYAQRKTVFEEDVEYALNFHSIKTDFLSSATGEIKKCNLKKVDQDNCVYIPQAQFASQVREFSHLRWTKKCLNLLQISIEKWIVGILYKASYIMQACKRDTLFGTDISIIKKILD